MAYRVFKAILLPFFRYFFRIRVEGLENIPRSGRAILASNHLAVFDSFFLPAVLKRRVTFVAKAEYFEDPKTAWFFRAAGQIPIKRSGGSASQGALDAAAEILEGDGLFGIYPEGTRSPDGRLYKGRTGVARLALRCHAPVIPVAMIGTRECQPIGQAMPNLFMPITIRIGKPLDFSRYADRANDPLVLRQITDEVMFELRSLSRQEYCDTYAKRNEAQVESTEPVKLATLDEQGLIGSSR
ncbi:MAG: lysophospholipid acyltransferase family protein [Actinomycetota bacterium]